MPDPIDIPAGVADVLSRALREDPGREALVTRRGRWTYRELDDAAARAARALRDLGVRPGDRVAAALPNEADIVFAFHGAMRLGAVWVGINQALAPPEKRFLLEDAGASVLLADDDTVAALVAAGAGAGDLRTVVAERDWRASCDTAEPLRDLAPVDPFEPAGLAYTSGTTGRPKGVVHSQHNLIVPGAVLVRSRGYGPELRKGDCLPLTILNMVALTTLLTAQAGGTSVVMDQMYAAGVAEWIQRERVTVWNGPPPLLHSLAHDDTVPGAALGTLREAWSGGSDLPETMRRAFADKFGVPVVGTYGLSEAPTVVSIDPVDGTHVDGASGRPLPHLTVTTIDDEGRPLPDGEAGEICLAPRDDGGFAGLYRPPLGYWNRPDATLETLVDGTVRTGDVGVIEDGWLSLRDRKKLVVIRGGANVYPAEVERVLHAIDGVAGSVVAGLPDERLGQRVVAAVELDPGASLGEEDILERCRSELARYKVPERIVLVDRLPRNAMAKVDRTAVAELFEG